MLKKNLDFSIKRLFFTVVLLLSLASNIILIIKYIEMKQGVQEIIESAFSLNDVEVEYKIVKSPSGFYSIDYLKGDVKKSAFIGSSFVSLDEFENQQVSIMGNFRESLGQPLCYKECRKGFREPVIDILAIEVVE